VPRRQRLRGGVADAPAAARRPPQRHLGGLGERDVARREPEGLPAFLAECELARGADPRLDAHLDALPATLEALTGDVGEAQWQARRAVEDLALAFQGSLLVRHAPAAVADAFCAGRLGEAGGRAFGTLPRGVDGAAIVDRALAAAA
jgi:putative acyl-CoA dehydrogenase